MKKRWYLLLIAAGLLLCAVPLQFPSISPSPSLLCWLRVGPYWWAVPSAPLLCQVIRIRDPVLLQAYKEQHDERNTMICEKAAARAARVMQGAVLYFGAAYARFLELPMWITWGLVGFCLAWGLLEWGLTLWYRHRM